MDIGTCAGHLPHQCPLISVDRFSSKSSHSSLRVRPPAFLNPVSTKGTGFRVESGFQRCLYLCWLRDLKSLNQSACHHQRALQGGIAEPIGLSRMGIEKTSQDAEAAVRAYEQDPQEHPQLTAGKNPLLLGAGRVPREG